MPSVSSDADLDQYEPIEPSVDMDALDHHNTTPHAIDPIMTAPRQPDMTTNDAERAATVHTTTFIEPNRPVPDDASPTSTGGNANQSLHARFGRIHPRN